MLPQRSERVLSGQYALKGGTCHRNAKAIPYWQLSKVPILVNQHVLLLSFTTYWEGDIVLAFVVETELAGEHVLE